MKPWKKMMVGLVLAAVLAGPAWAQKPVYNFQGGVKTRPDQGLSIEQLRPGPTDSLFSTWCYTFILYLDDDSSLTIQFTYWKLALVDQHAVIFSFIDRGETRHLRKPTIAAEDFEYRDSPPRLRMGPHFWEGYYPDFKIHLDFAEEPGQPAIKADLNLHCRTPGWRPGEGPVHYGAPDGPWYDLVVMIPWADLTGTLTIGGQQRQVKGHGYSDHNRQNVLPTTQLDWLMALRSFSDQYSVNFLEYVAPAEYGAARSTWIIVMKDHRILYATDQWERELHDIATESRRGYKYATRVTVRIDQPDCRLEGEIKGVKFIELLDAMDEMPAFLRPVVETFVKAPVWVRQNAVVEWRLVMPGEGIDDRFTTRGVFETSIVR